jgi:lathosterol oxidase
LECVPELLQNASIARLVLVLVAFFGGLTVLSLVSGFTFERLFPKRQVFAVPLSKGQLRFELLGNLVFVGVTVASFTAALEGGVVSFGPESLVRISATFFALLVGFQIFYYGLHRAMHTRALMWIHRWHHRSHVTTALSAQSVSFGEACGWMIGYVGIPILFSLVVPISFFGWAAYMAFNVSGNVVGHANVELSSPASRTKLVSMFANPWIYHALHHARYNGHYSFQAAIMDRLFRTEWSDWPSLFDRILRGEPLRNLHERADVDAPPGQTY